MNVQNDPCRTGAVTDDFVYEPNSMSATQPIDDPVRIEKVLKVFSQPASCEQFMAAFFAETREPIPHDPAFHCRRSKTSVFENPARYMLLDLIIAISAIEI
jgi:hypothetical protein